MARSATRNRATPRKAHRRRAEPAVSAQAVQAAQAPQAALPSLPSDPGAVRPGQIYSGGLPAPRPAAEPATISAPSPPPAEPPRTAAANWSDVGHFVAANLSPEHSVLLARGGDPAAPRWVPCAGKPPAVLAAASTILAGPALEPTAQSWLDALRVLGAKTVLVARDPAEAAAIKAALARTDLPAPVEGDTLIVAGSEAQMPAVRASVGARYCVVALVGRSAVDFPNGLTPATTPPALATLWGAGWFLLAGNSG